MSRDALKEQLKRIIFDSVEGPKIDYKRDLNYKSAVEKVEFAKDVSSILNTDDPANFQDVGYVIFGAELGRIIGAHSTLVNSDKLQNELESALRSYISPATRLSVVCYTTETGEPWGAVVLAPSREQPHIFIKELSGNPARGDWYVRNGSSKDKAAPHDYDRIKRKSLAQAVEPLKDQFAALTARLAIIEQRQESTLMNALSQVARTATGNQDDAYELGEAVGIELASRLRRRLRGTDDRLAEELVAEALELRVWLETETIGVPWNLTPQDPNICRSAIVLLESRSEKLLDSLAVIAQNDDKHSFIDAIRRAIWVLAKEVSAPPGTNFNTAGEVVRFYPLTILLYALAIICTTNERPSILREALQVPFRDPYRGLPPAPLAPVLGSLRMANEVFNAAFGNNYCDAVGLRLFDLLKERLSDFYVTEEFAPAFFIGEFILSLAHVEAKGSRGYPMPGIYLYRSYAQITLLNFLKNPPDWFEMLFQMPIVDLLTSFDENARSMTDVRCHPGGLRRGALKAYQRV